MNLGYIELSDELAQELANCEPGTLVPSEHQLAARFRVSRATARTVLQELERRYIVRRSQGRGTFVNRRLEYRLSLDGTPPSFTEAVRRAGREPVTRNGDVVVRKATEDERRLLGLRASDPVAAFWRARFLEDDDLVGAAECVLPAELVPALGQVIGENGSLFRALAGHYGFRPVREWVEVHMEVASAELARQLRLRGRPSLIHTSGTVVDGPSGRPLEYRRNWLRGDIFELVAELGSRPDRTGPDAGEEAS
jgi:GntR family transcriptional regulator